MDRRHHSQPARIRKNRVMHSCPQCGKAFTKRSNMLIHARLHTGETPYVCRFRGCGRSYKWLSSINFHEGRCDKRAAGLAVPAPKPPPPPAAAEAARVAAAAASHQALGASVPDPAAAALPPARSPLHPPISIQPLPSYQSLQLTAQGRAPSPPPPPPPPPPLRPPPNFSHQQHVQQQLPHPSQMAAQQQPHHLQQQQQQHYHQQHQQLPQYLPHHAHAAPSLQHAPSHPLPPSQPSSAPHPFHTPRKGRGFRPDMIPMSPVTPHKQQPQQAPQLHLTHTNPHLGGGIKRPAPDPLVASPSLDHTTILVSNIVGLKPSKRSRNSHQYPHTPVLRREPAFIPHPAPPSPESATSNEIKEMLAPNPPPSSMWLGSSFADNTAATTPSHTTRVPSSNPDLDSIGDTFGFSDDDFLIPNCPIGTVFDDLAGEEMPFKLDQCTPEADTIAIFP